MPEYKHQHWLPASYLQFFSASGSPEGRDSVVYVTNADSSQPRKVANVAVANFLYSRLDPKAAEERFHRAEGIYPELLRVSLSGNPLSKAHRMQFLLIMLDLHFRNPIYENKTSKERTDAAEHMARDFLIRRVAELSEVEAQDLDRVVGEVFARWEVSGVEMPPTAPLWTSDHPSLLFSVGTDRSFAFAVLPATPAHILIAYRRSLVALTANDASHADAQALNTYQVLLCGRELYCDRDLSAQVGKDSALGKRLSNRPTERGWVTDARCSPEVVSYPHDGLSFSFVSVVGER